MVPHRSFPAQVSVDRSFSFLAAPRTFPIRMHSSSLPYLVSVPSVFNFSPIVLSIFGIISFLPYSAAFRRSFLFHRKSIVLSHLRLLCSFHIGLLPSSLPTLNFSCAFPIQPHSIVLSLFRVQFHRSFLSWHSCLPSLDSPHRS